MPLLPTHTSAGLPSPSGVGSQTTEAPKILAGHRNWSCGCQPGLLGPPAAILPPQLRLLVESFAAGPTSSWQIRYAPGSAVVRMEWPTILLSNQKSFLPIPPPLLTALSMLPGAPQDWSCDFSTNKLSCTISWLFTEKPSVPEAPTSPLEADSPSTDSLDSGFSLTSPDSSHNSLNSNSLDTLRRDLFNDTPELSPSLPTSDATTQVLLSTSDAVTSTTSPSFTNACCEASPSTLSGSTQTSHPQSRTAESQTLTPEPLLAQTTISTGSQTLRSQSLLPTINTQSTATQADLDEWDTFLKPLVGFVDDASSHLSKKQKKKQPKTTKRYRSTGTQPAPSTNATATDSTTQTLNPAVTCNACCQLEPNEHAIVAHAFSCDNLPTETQKTIDSFTQKWSKTLKLPPTLFATICQLRLLCFDSDDPIAMKATELLEHATNNTPPPDPFTELNYELEDLDQTTRQQLRKRCCMATDDDLKKVLFSSAEVDLDPNYQTNLCLAQQRLLELYDDPESSDEADTPFPDEHLLDEAHLNDVFFENEEDEFCEDIEDDFEF